MKYKATAEEKELMASIENEEWVEVENFEEEKARYEQYATAAINADKEINLRISERDFDGFRRKAIDEGLTYQALMGSILHKFINGRLVEKM